MKFKKRIAFFTAIIMALLTVGCGSKSMSASEDSATMESVYGTDYSENNVNGTGFTHNNHRTN